MTVALLQFSKSEDVSSAIGASAAGLKCGKLQVKTPLLRVALTVLVEFEVFGSSPVAYSSRFGNRSPSGFAEAPLMFVFASSAGVNLPARQASKFEFTVMMTTPCAVL